MTAAALGLSAFWPATAAAAPALRFQNDLHGDFALFGNSGGYDCGNGTPVPLVGTVGACGTSVSDSSPDIFWAADNPAAGSATANTGITVAGARTTAVLALPPGAVITYARLYWAAIVDAAQPDAAVVVDRPGVFTAPLSADVTHTVTLSTTPALIQYESSADVTDLVRLEGNGAYRISGIAAEALPDLNDSRAFIAWSCVVMYELTGEPLRQLTLFDGLDAANSGAGLTVNVSGFLVPNSGVDAKIGIVAYGGDGQTGGDSLAFNGTQLTDGVASTNNFFNSSRTWLGAPISVAGDLPRLSGELRSMSGLDLDVVDVTALVPPASTSATANIKAGGDNNVLLGALVTSITTFKPNFNDTIKSVTDLNGGLVLPGDTLRYTVDVVNSGNDPGVGVVLDDLLPAQVAYVPNSLVIASGTNAGPKTDPSGDDQAEYDAALHTVRFRLGTGANATTGGTMAINETASVTFDVIVNTNATGIISNQATIQASGLRGSPVATYSSDDGTGAGPTDVRIDQCQTDNDCPAAKPHCFNPTQAGLPNVCVECLTQSDCSGTTPICALSTHSCEQCASDAECASKDPTLPACQSSGTLAGACTECSGSNPSLCTGSKPECLTNVGVCGCSDTDGDSECGGSNSGIICNGPAGTCVPGCIVGVAGRNDCPTSQFCSDQTGQVGVCQGEPCVVDADCPSPFVRCDTTPQPHQCVRCLVDADCPQPFICNPAHTCVECTSTNTSNCDITGDGAACLTNGTCGCVTDTDCGAVDSGRVCDGTTSLCVPGCRGTGGNGCPTTLVCTSSDATVGSCVECVTDNDCSGATPLCNTTRHHCVGCITNGDCTNQAPVCDQTSGTCTGCTSDADCTDATAPACQVSGTLAGQCTECSGTNATLCASDKPICLAQIGICGCTSTDGDSECGAQDSGMICSGAAGTCVPGCVVGVAGRNDCPVVDYCSDQTGGVGTCLTQCNTTADCASGQVCNTAPIPHVCVQCVADADCPTGQVCDETTNTCVGCVTSADCANQQVCDPSTSTCVGCVTDADCPTGQVCDPTTQTCGECNDNADCPTGKVCNTTDHTCVGCVTSADCTGEMVCDPGTSTCVGCTSDSDCPSGQHCDSGSQTCVECVTDADCPTGQVCDPTTHTCGECTTQDPSSCASNPNGTVCLTDTCGCNSDADCPSGSVCNGTKCEPGCHVGDPNACASGEKCVAGDSGDIGTCTPDVITGVVSGSGCACSTPQQSPRNDWWWAAGALALALARRRRGQRP